MPSLSSQSPVDLNGKSSSLRLMLDDADYSHWQQWLPLGLFYGVTTNPLLLERAGVPCQVERLTDLATAAFELGAQEVQLQTWGDDEAQYVQVGKKLSAIDPERIVVKVPATQVGTSAAATLIRSGVRVTLTAVFAEHQALIAAAIGADYAAPYLGRIHDTGRKGCEVLTAMQQALDGIGSPTRLLVASIRRVEDITLLATQRLNTFTISTAIAAQLFQVQATIDATIAFEQAALRSLQTGFRQAN
ncbi:MAG TPA: transaldolase family protein [Stenomitos sp.]